MDYAVHRLNPVRDDNLHPWRTSVAYYYYLGKILMCLILSPLLSWGCMPYDTCSVPFMVLCTIRLLHVAPMMHGNLVYYELPLFSQVWLMVCGWNRIIRRCEYRLICGKGFLIAWENLDWFLPAVRVCPKIEYGSLCLRCTVPLRNGSWIFEPLSIIWLIIIPP